MILCELIFRSRYAFCLRNVKYFSPCLINFDLKICSKLYFDIFCSLAFQDKKHQIKILEPKNHSTSQNIVKTNSLIVLFCMKSHTKNLKIWIFAQKLPALRPLTSLHFYTYFTKKADGPPAARGPRIGHPCPRAK